VAVVRVLSFSEMSTSAAARLTVAIPRDELTADAYAVLLLMPQVPVWVVHVSGSAEPAPSVVPTAEVLFVRLNVSVLSGIRTPGRTHSSRPCK
jgi:hypothetical protein